MIAIISIAVASIVFCVLAFFSSKTWLWRHVSLLFGVFVMTMLFLVMAAASLKTQQVWRGQYEKLSGELENAGKRIAELRGPTQISPQEQSLPQLNAELSRELLSRGRVWRGAVLAGADADTIKLDISHWNNAGCVRSSVDEMLTPEPAAEEGGEAAPQSPQPLVTEMLLHAFVNAPVSGLSADQQSMLFGETDLPQQETRAPCSLPSVYLGQFIVASTDAASISLKSVRPLDEAQRAAMQSKADWTLYEVLPVDGHDVFAGKSEEMLLSLFPASQDVPIDKFRAAVSEYIRDQTAAENQDPPERIQSKIKFISDHTIQVDIEGEAIPGEGRVYDARGRAIPQELRQGHPSDFKAGDVEELDSVTAKRLVDQGVAEFVDEPSRYVRALRNYELVFRYAHDAQADLRQAIDTVEAEVATLQKNTQQIQDRIAFRTQEKQLLQQDLAGFEKDLAAAKSLLASLRQRRETQVETLNQLFQSNRLRAGLPTP